jgi:hypothetical protein
VEVSCLPAVGASALELHRPAVGDGRAVASREDAVDLLHGSDPRSTPTRRAAAIEILAALGMMAFLVGFPLAIFVIGTSR